MKNMKDKCFVYVGNRYYVYKKMVQYNLNIVKVFAVRGSYLEEYLINNEIEFEYIDSKRELINMIKEQEYDILISSGCPYILPVTELTKLKRDSKYINIHTSLLPDCKGRHPINAALLFGRKHGVTCHYMDDGIDTGDIIEQIEIPITDDVSLELLYKISFITEADVFEKALNNNFRVKKQINECVNTIYYTRNKQDYYIKTEDDVDMLFRRVRAFSTKGQYAKINIAGEIVEIKNAKLISNPFVVNKYMSVDNNKVCVTYGNNILMKFQGKLLELETVNYGIKELSMLENKIIL